MAHKFNQIEQELRQAMAAKKCWRCGCFQDTVNTLQKSEAINTPLHDLFDEASRLFEDKRYDCLGCDICWPAVAQNIAAEIDPVIAEGSHCATAEPELQEGWPPLPGDYRVVCFQAPVAVCTLNSGELITELASGDITGLSIIGSLHTENLGIEHLIRNLLANPNIRFLILCGEDTQRAIGHLPGQSLASLLRHGIDEKRRIIGARGKRPFIKNLDGDHVEVFRQQVQLIDHIGETNPKTLRMLIAEAAVNNPGPVTTILPDAPSILTETVATPHRLILDPAGYFVVYPDPVHQRITLEHYTNKGVLDRVFEATDPAALYAAVIDEKLISRLDHTAYLGRELARAEQSLKNGEPYVQDRAPGEVQKVPPTKPTSCHCLPTEGKSCE